MKNKKGYTLVELIVGLSLLSIIIVFMMSLLVDLKAKENEEGIDTEAQVLQATLSKTINSDINKYGVDNFSSIVSTNENEDIIKITFKDNTSKYITITNDTNISYGSLEETEMIKDLPEQYIVSDAYVLNDDTGLKKIVIEIENKNNDKLNFNIEAYSYDKKQDITNENTNNGSE